MIGQHDPSRGAKKSRDLDELDYDQSPAWTGTSVRSRGTADT